MEEGILGVSELAGDRVVGLIITCEGDGYVVGSPWRTRPGYGHGVKRRSRATQRETLIMDGMWMKVRDSRTT